jgi:hypothetical protein
MHTTALRTAALAATLLFGLGVAISGCAGNATAEAKPSASPTEVTEEDSTTAQWASLISRQSAEWEEWKASWDEAGCSSITAAMPDGITCRISLLSATFMTQTTSIEYELATGPGKKGYIAERPPAEIESLYDETVAAAEAAQVAGAAWDDAGCATDGADCAGLAFTFESAIDDLLGQFAAWEPYM